MITDRLWHDAESYVRQLFGADLGSRPADTGLLPFFLTEKYEIREGRLLGRPALLLGVEGRDLDAPTTSAKHMALVRGALGLPVVLVTDALSAHGRQRLIQSSVNFMVPGNQLFLPEFGTDLREHFRAAERPVLEQLTPAAQVIVLAKLLGEDLDGLTPKALADRFQYTPMSAGRAVDELKQRDLIDVTPRGRERRIGFDQDPGRLWRTARPLLQSPIRATRAVGDWPAGISAPAAGETALSIYTDMGPPRQPVVAVTSRSWKGLVYDHDLSPADPHDPGATEVQSWSYDPRILIHASPVVDRISLYLTLQDRHDDRVREAADALLEPFPWS